MNLAELKMTFICGLRKKRFISKFSVNDEIAFSILANEKEENPDVNPFDPARQEIVTQAVADEICKDCSKELCYLNTMMDIMSK